jgi:hypothetical protein
MSGSDLLNAASSLLAASGDGLRAQLGDKVLRDLIAKLNAASGMLFPLSFHPLFSPSLYTLSLHPLFTPSLYTLSLHPLFTPSLYTLSLHPLTSQMMNLHDDES